MIKTVLYHLAIVGVLLGMLGCYRSSTPTTTVVVQGTELSYHRFMRGIGHSSESYGVLVVNRNGTKVEFDKLKGLPPYYLAAPDDNWIVMARSTSIDNTELIVLDLSDCTYFSFPCDAMVFDYIGSPEVRVFREQEVLVVHFDFEGIIMEAKIDTKSRKYLGELRRDTRARTPK